MELKLFQTDWFGISLTEIAAEVGLRPGGLADARVYQRLYEVWRQRGYSADPDWAASKPRVAALIWEAVGRPNATALSVGAGLGLVEHALARSGWQVELQEFQDASFDEARRSWNPKVWITDGLASLTGRAYDVVLLVSVSYALPQGAYRTMLMDARRLLRPGGFVVVWEHDAKIPVRPRRGVFWGWVRPPGVHVRLAKEAGLDLVRRRHFDEDLNPIAPGFRLNGFQLPRGRSLVQLLVFRSRVDNETPGQGDTIASGPPAEVTSELIQNRNESG